MVAVEEVSRHSSAVLTATIQAVFAGVDSVGVVAAQAAAAAEASSICLVHPHEDALRERETESVSWGTK